jgi:hypothetical protein
LATLVLAGELERAADYVDRIQRNDAIRAYEKASVKAHWERISSDIEALCTEFHAKEAETARALKLEHVWEPSPFPVELPSAERAGRTAEPIFSVTPWVGRPSWLFGEAPEQPGEVRYAKAALYRNGRVLLLVPLTYEQAEQRHRDLEDYVLAVRPTLAEANPKPLKKPNW